MGFSITPKKGRIQWPGKSLWPFYPRSLEVTVIAFERVTWTHHPNKVTAWITWRTEFHPSIYIKLLVSMEFLTVFFFQMLAPAGWWREQHGDKTIEEHEKSGIFWKFILKGFFSKLKQMPQAIKRTNKHPPQKLSKRNTNHRFFQKLSSGLIILSFFLKKQKRTQRRHNLHFGHVRPCVLSEPCCGTCARTGTAEKPSTSHESLCGRWLGGGGGMIFF